MNMKWSSFKTSLLLFFCSLQSLSAVNIAPGRVMLQSGGGMGVVSVGTGWRYGSKNRWGTDIIAGFVPKYDSNSAKLVVALKENFAPWAIAINKHISFTPLTASLYYHYREQAFLGIAARQISVGILRTVDKDTCQHFLRRAD